MSVELVYRDGRPSRRVRRRRSGRHFAPYENDVNWYCNSPGRCTDREVYIHRGGKWLKMGDEKNPNNLHICADPDRIPGGQGGECVSTDNWENTGECGGYRQYWQKRGSRRAHPHPCNDSTPSPYKTGCMPSPCQWSGISVAKPRCPSKTTYNAPRLMFFKKESCPPTPSAPPAPRASPTPSAPPAPQASPTPSAPPLQKVVPNLYEVIKLKDVGGAGESVV